MKLFDDIFRENVDKAFSGYNAGHLADEGWNSFLASRKKEGKLRALIIPLWAKAASIALLVGAGALTTYLLTERNHSDIGLAARDPEPAKEISAPVKSIASNASSTVGTNKITQGRNDREAGTIVYAEPGPSSIKPATDDQQVPATAIVTADTELPPVFAENQIAEPQDTLSITFKEANQVKEDGEAIAAVTSEEKSRYVRPGFITGMSGIMSHVKDAASSSAGVSVGFWIDQRITKRISFRPGLALAVNSLGFDKQSQSYESYYKVSLIDGNSGTIDSYNGELRMVAMELPLNIVFKVFERKRSGIYLSAGASTMVYFSQNFTGDFVNVYTMEYLSATTGAMASETRASKVSVENSYSALNHTDYFGLANFSAAWSVPYGKTSTLLIEPFMQFPLSDLTAMNLRVRYGGISMKVRFGGKVQ